MFGIAGRDQIMQGLNGPRKEAGDYCPFKMYLFAHCLHRFCIPRKKGTWLLCFYIFGSSVLQGQQEGSINMSSVVSLLQS